MENTFAEFTPIGLNSSPSKEEIAQYYTSNNVATDNDFLDNYLGLNKVAAVKPATSDKTFVPGGYNIGNILGKGYKPSTEGISKPTPTTGNPLITAATTNAKVKTAIDYFTKQGLTREQAAGIVGNLHAESGLNTTALGDNKSSYGLAQWHNERWTGLKNFAKQKGTTEDDFQTQLEYLWSELQGSEKGAYQELLRAKTPVEAARIFAHKFERMAKYNPQREQMATQFFNT